MRKVVKIMITSTNLMSTMGILTEAKEFVYLLLETALLAWALPNLLSGFGLNSLPSRHY